MCGFQSNAAAHRRRSRACQGVAGATPGATQNVLASAYGSGLSLPLSIQYMQAPPTEWARGLHAAATHSSCSLEGWSTARGDAQSTGEMRCKASSCCCRAACCRSRSCTRPAAEPRSASRTICRSHHCSVCCDISCRRGDAPTAACTRTQPVLSLPGRTHPPSLPCAQPPYHNKGQLGHHGILARPSPAGPDVPDRHNQRRPCTAHTHAPRIIAVPQRPLAEASFGLAHSYLR